MEANIIGLIELENGLCCQRDELFGDVTRQDAEWGYSLCRDDEAPRSVPTAPTRFVRADFGQLQQDLQAEFEALLQRLFESDE